MHTILPIEGFQSLVSEFPGATDSKVIAALSDIFNYALREFPKVLKIILSFLNIELSGIIENILVTDTYKAPIYFKAERNITSCENSPIATRYG